MKEYCKAVLVCGGVDSSRTGSRLFQVDDEPDRLVLFQLLPSGSMKDTLDSPTVHTLLMLQYFCVSVACIPHHSLLIDKAT